MHPTVAGKHKAPAPGHSAGYVGCLGCLGDHCGIGSSGGGSSGGGIPPTPEARLDVGHQARLHLLLGARTRHPPRHREAT